jgi:hypothetical protein
VVDPTVTVAVVESPVETLTIAEVVTADEDPPAPPAPPYNMSITQSIEGRR